MNREQEPGATRTWKFGVPFAPTPLDCSKCSPTLHSECLCGALCEKHLALSDGRPALLGTKGMTDEH